MEHDYDYCRWTYCSICEAYETECGSSFVFNDGTPKQNGFMFCPYCGKPIIGGDK